MEDPTEQVDYLLENIEQSMWFLPITFCYSILTRAFLYEEISVTGYIAFIFWLFRLSTMEKVRNTAISKLV